jgi:hypothetical protein
MDVNIVGRSPSAAQLAEGVRQLLDTIRKEGDVPKDTCDRIRQVIPLIASTGPDGQPVQIDSRYNAVTDFLTGELIPAVPLEVRLAFAGLLSKSKYLYVGERKLRDMCAIIRQRRDNLACGDLLWWADQSRGQLSYPHVLL